MAFFIGGTAGAVVGSGLIGAAGSLIGASMASDASGDATAAQQQSAAAANAEQQREYDQNRTDNQPALAARNAGLSGYQSLLNNPSSIASDPGYQFGLTQGTGAIDASAASRGGLYSGATLKALQRYGQDYGSTKYDAALGRQSTLAGLGQPGAAAISSAGQNNANQQSSNLLGVGNSQAANALNQGSIWQNAVNGVSSYAKNSVSDGWGSNNYFDTAAKNNFGSNLGGW